MRSFLLLAVLLLFSSLQVVTGFTCGFDEEFDEDDCEKCVDMLDDVSDCIDDEDCERDECLDENLDWEECCEDCATMIEVTSACFDACLPTSFSEAADRYAQCVRYTPFDCEDDCRDDWQDYSEGVRDSSDNDLSEFVEKDSDGRLRLRLADAIDNIDEDELTCENVEDNFVDNGCELAECCEQCVEEFEVLSACLLNRVMFNIFGPNENDCDVQCDDRRRFLVGRILQEEMGNATEAPTEAPANATEAMGNATDPPVTVEPKPWENAEVPAYVEECRNLLIASLVLGLNASAGSNYLECMLENQASDEPPEKESTDTSSAVVYAAGALLGSITAIAVSGVVGW